MMAAAECNMLKDIQFVKDLASSERTTRERGIRNFQKWICRSKSDLVLSQLPKVWKGLYVCLWMSDKPILQQQLSQHISSTILAVEDMEVVFGFWSIFWKTIAREWSSIDQYRLDKFYFLMKTIVSDVFRKLDKSGWAIATVSKFMSVLQSEVMLPAEDATVPDALRYFLADRFCFCLRQAIDCNLRIESDLLSTILEPFFAYVSRGPEENIIIRIFEEVFAVLLNDTQNASANDNWIDVDRSGLRKTMQMLRSKCPKKNRSVVRRECSKLGIFDAKLERFNAPNESEISAASLWKITCLNTQLPRTTASSNGFDCVPMSVESHSSAQPKQCSVVPNNWRSSNLSHASSVSETPTKKTLSSVKWGTVERKDFLKKSPVSHIRSIPSVESAIGDNCF